MAIKPKNEPEPKRVVLIAGGPKNVVYAQVEDGTSHARDYMNGLSESDQRKFAVQLRKLSLGHRIENPQRIRDLQLVTVSVTRKGTLVEIKVKLWEVKIDGHRMLTFQDGNDWVLTNGAPKIAKKAFQGEIETAVNVLRNYLGR